MLKNLKLENFRNHRSLDINFGQVTVLAGPNGSGKSNILEAIVVLAFCRSFRQEKKANLINFDSDLARVNGDGLELIFCRLPQFLFKARINSVPKRTTDFIGALPAVILSPETLNVITGSPADRRRFFDILISQVDRQYLKALIDYTKVRRQRNQLLRRIKQRLASEDELEYWDKELSGLGLIISRARAEATVELNRSLSLTYQSVAGASDLILKLNYIQRSTDLALDLKQFRPRDIADERTNLGPHSDDLLFELNGRDMANFASRGEIKSATLALKIGELKYLSEKRRSKPAKFKIDRPLLLLDDVFSEFDPQRRAKLVDLIEDYQTIITTADPDSLPEKLKRIAKIKYLK